MTILGVRNQQQWQCSVRCLSGVRTICGSQHLLQTLLKKPVSTGWNRKSFVDLIYVSDGSGKLPCWDPLLWQDHVADSYFHDLYDNLMTSKITQQHNYHYLANNPGGWSQCEIDIDSTRASSHFIESDSSSRSGLHQSSRWQWCDMWWCDDVYKPALILL